VQLDGTASRFSASWLWTFNDFPNGSATTIINPTTPTPTIVPDIPGDYVLDLAVTNPNGTSHDIVLIEVIQPNRPPVIAGDNPLNLEMVEDSGTLEIIVLVSDADLDPLLWSITSSPLNGSVGIDENGTGAGLYYTPAANFHGLDSFTVKVDDSRGGVAELTVNISVTNPLLSAEIDAAVTAACSLRQQEIFDLETVLGYLYFGDFDRDSDVDGFDLSRFTYYYGTTELDIDNDGDGFAEINGDCDDADPDVNPDAAEICDGFDNNCNGEIDENCPQ